MTTPITIHSTRYTIAIQQSRPSITIDPRTSVVVVGLKGGLPGPRGLQGPPGLGSGGVITAVTTATGELVVPQIIDGVLDWVISGYSQASPDIFIAETGESLQAFVTNGDEGQKFIEWRVL